MRVLIINQPYWPDVAATAQLLADWAPALAARGHAVTVVAARSAYGQAGDRWPAAEMHNGVRVCRVGGSLFAKGPAVLRAVDGGLFHLRALVRAWRLGRQDVVICLTSPPLIGWVGAMLQRFRGAIYVQYEMDLYPDIAVSTGVLAGDGLPATAMGAVHRSLLRTADRVVAVGRCMRDRLVRAGVSAEKVRVVTPWADPAATVPVPRVMNLFRARHGLGDAFVVMYAGNFGRGHDAATLCGVMRRLHDEGEAGVRFVFVGGGRRVAEICGYARAHRLPAPLVLPYQPREALGEVLSAADLHLVTQAAGTEGQVVPSKLYGILAAGRPCLYIGPAGTEVAMTVGEHGVGSCVLPGDVEGAVAAVRAWRHRQREGEAFERRAREVCRMHFSREIGCAQLTAVVEELAATGAVRGEAVRPVAGGMKPR